MKDQIITFETAKLAKEKGFSEKINTLMKPGIQYYNHKGILNGDVSEYIKRQLNKENIQGFESIAAPTQSLLQKWLREKHNLFITIEQDFESYGDPINGRGDRLMKHSGKYFLIVRTESLGLDSPNSSLFNSYEEALEYGLQTALKLINNERTNN